MNDVILQFAILWGETIGSALSYKEMQISDEMKQYNSDELLMIFSGWAEEYYKNERSDTVAFFHEKLTDLLHK